MKEKYLMIYGENADYIFRFAEYIRRKTRLPLKLRAFTDEEELKQEMEELLPDILIVPEEKRDAPYAGTLREKKGSLFYFTESLRPDDPEALYLYRPMERQLRQLLHQLKLEETTAARQKETVVWGVYSPVRGAGQTAAALLLGQFLAENDSCLYLNFERFSGFSRLIPREKEGDLSDLLYFARVKGSFGERLPELTEYLGPLGLIFPASAPDDLRSAAPEDYVRLIESLAETGLYRYLVLDIGDGPNDERALLRLCRRIFMPVRKDMISGAKEAEWLSAMEQQEEEFSGRIRRFSLPELTETEEFMDYRRLRFSAWGQAVRALLREEDL